MPTYECAFLGLRLNLALIAGVSAAAAALFPWVLLGPPWRYAVPPIFVLVAAWGVWRSFRLAVEATPDRIVVRNFWRTYEFSWLDVEKVTTGGIGELLQSRIVIGFWLRNDKFIPAQGTPSRPADQLAVIEALAAIAPPSVDFDENLLEYLQRDESLLDSLRRRVLKRD